MGPAVFNNRDSETQQNIPDVGALSWIAEISFPPQAHWF
jgi:hypothetical protein